jgi:hypothetical protein
MSALAAVNATPELATFPPVSRAILAIAFDERRPLRPVTLETDREVLLRAEHLVRRERLLGREALARARDEEIDVATVRGIYRFARALLKDDDVVAFEDGAVRELSRRELVDEAFRLFALPPAPPVEITVEDVLAAFPGSVEITGGAVELDALGDPLGEEFGSIVGLCAHCGDAVRAGADGELTLAVFTFTDRALSKRAWRFVAPSDVTAKTGKPSKLASLLFEAEEPVLCHACATRLSAGLLSQTPDAPELVVTPEPAGGGGPYFAPRLDRMRSELQLEQIAPTLYLTRGGIIVKPRPRTPDVEGDRAVDDHVGADVLEHDEVVATPGAVRHEPELEQREPAEIDRHDRQDVQELETTTAALAHESRIEAGMSIDAFLGVRR